ncbi:MAG TPA: hypothetical protein VF250_09550 [Conexibacter sp.]
MSPSPAMVVACIAVVLALTGSAFAAALITGADIQNGSITRADLSRGTINSLKGKTGRRGPSGRDGFTGARGPQGDTGPAGPQGPAGPVGPAGPKGNVGDTGAQGPIGRTGAQGVQGVQGDPGTPGQSLVFNTAVGATDAGTPIAQSSTGPSSSEGIENSNGGTFLSAGTTYKVDVFVSFVATANPGTEFGVARLFLDSNPLDGSGSDPTGGNADMDTTVVSADVPDDSSNPAQASASFLVTPGDNGGGGEQLTLRSALRTDDGTTTANVTGHIIVTRIG